MISKPSVASRRYRSPWAVPVFTMGGMRIENCGYRHGPPEVLARLGAEKPVSPDENYFRTVPRFETGTARYRWLDRVVCVAVGERRVDEVLITVYEVT